MIVNTAFKTMFLTGYTAFATDNLGFSAYMVSEQCLLCICNTAAS